MREPEGEEHDVIGPLRLPQEQVGDEVVHVGSPDSLAVQVQGLGRRVNDGQMPSSAGETRRPPPGASCHFQDVSCRAEGVKRTFDLRDLSIPFLGRARTSVVATAPLPPLVVLGRTSSVIRPLLGEQTLVVHRQKSLTRCTHVVEVRCRRRAAPTRTRST